MLQSSKATALSRGNWIRFMQIQFTWDFPGKHLSWKCEQAVLQLIMTEGQKDKEKNKHENKKKCERLLVCSSSHHSKGNVFQILVTAERWDSEPIPILPSLPVIITGQDIRSIPEFLDNLSTLLWEHVDECLCVWICTQCYWKKHRSKITQTDKIMGY